MIGRRTTPGSVIRLLARLSVWLLAAALACLALALPVGAAAKPPVSIFYYPWYGTPELDGSYEHWEKDGHVPPADLAASYYPLRGAYSSSDAKVVGSQMREIAAAGVGELISSWWGWGTPEDLRLPLVMREARAAGLDIAVQIEPDELRTEAWVEEGIQHLLELGITRFYVYQPFGLSDAFWVALNARLANVEVLAQTGNVARAASDGFDGVYTYDIVGYGPGTFARICARARALRLVCAPSVGPGYEAELVTGDGRRLPRRDGRTYDAMWQAAIRARADRVTITSYNEWHEGTQIEPARSTSPRQPAGTPVERRYGDYQGSYGLSGRSAPRAYLARTAFWAKAYGAGSELRGPAALETPPG
jgi:hypothetical protein